MNRRALADLTFSAACTLGLLVFVSDVFAQTFSNQASTIFGGNINFDSRSASLADIDNDGDLDLFSKAGAVPNSFTATT
jgi:hypothetical protein